MVKNEGEQKLKVKNEVAGQGAEKAERGLSEECW